MTVTQTQGLTRMTDEARIRWIAVEDTTRDACRPGLPVVMLHGGPGLPDYLGDVAAMIADLAPVYRYDQRGTGRSEWQGRHSVARHVDDLAELLDAWGAAKAVLIGHSYGTDLASRFCLAHPDRVAALLLLCGPFVGDWRTADRAERARRMTAAQQERLRELEALAQRTEDEEVELLTLTWFTDHADPRRGWRWAAHDARKRRPVNWSMNSELGQEGRADPIEQHLDALRACRPPHTELLGGSDDPRPISALESLAHRLEVPLARIDGGGHEPWLEQPELVRGHLRRFVQEAVSLHGDSTRSGQGRTDRRYGAPAGGAVDSGGSRAASSPRGRWMPSSPFRKRVSTRFGAWPSRATSLRPGGSRKAIWRSFGPGSRGVEPTGS